MVNPVVRHRISTVYMLVKILGGRQPNNSMEKAEDQFLLQIRDSRY